MPHIAQKRWPHQNRSFASGQTTLHISGQYTMAEPTPIWTPPRPLFRHAHPTRLDRASIDSSSSLATTNLQTPDRANFPRFASPIAEAGPSCERHAEGVEGSEEESVWEDMESGGLLEVKIGNLLNVSFPLLPTSSGSAAIGGTGRRDILTDAAHASPIQLLSTHYCTLLRAGL